MKSSHKRVTYVAIAAIVATGGAYAVLDYLCSVEDEFGVAPHPWTATMHRWHVLTAPLFVFALGLIWDTHIAAKLRSGARARRRTGIALLTQSLPMIVSGYAIQVSVDEWWRWLWVLLHLISSGLFVVLFAMHLVARVKPART